MQYTAYIYFLLPLFTAVLCFNISSHYIGCFLMNGTLDSNDSSPMTLLSSPQCSADECSNECMLLNQTFSGNKDCECYCSHFFLPPYAPATVDYGSDCDIPCSGNSAYMCGGSAYVSVYSVCPYGKYGPSCDLDCSVHCLSPGFSLCNYESGSCTFGCMNDAVGPLCHCPFGTYGKECNFDCSPYCVEDMNCDHISGACVGGCRGPWLPPKCIFTEYPFGQQSSAVALIISMGTTVTVMTAVCVTSLPYLILWFHYGMLIV